MNTRQRGRTKQAKFTDLQRRFRFHFANGGGIVGRQAIGALRAARAEQQAETQGIVFVWDWDKGGMDSLGDHEYWCNTARREAAGRSFNGDVLSARYIERNGHEHEVRTCAACRPCPDHGTDCRHTTELASLGGIIDPTPEYRRVIEAELAIEALTYNWVDPNKCYTY